jgi:hypothetical protein
MSFVSYTPNEAIMNYGKDIVIINGEDNWNGCKIFHIAFLLRKFGIEKLGNFHDGLSGITTSGCVIKKADLAKFIENFNKRKWALRREEGPGQMFNVERISIFDPEVNEWKVFFEMKYGDIQYEKEPSNGIYNCRHQATCTVNNFQKCEIDMSYYFNVTSPKTYFKKVDKF